MVQLIFQDRRLAVSGKTLTPGSHPFHYQSPSVTVIAVSFILAKYFITFFFKNHMHSYCP